MDIRFDQFLFQLMAMTVPIMIRSLRKMKIIPHMDTF